MVKARVIAIKGILYMSIRGLICPDFRQDPGKICQLNASIFNSILKGCTYYLQNNKKTIKTKLKYPVPKPSYLKAQGNDEQQTVYDTGGNFFVIDGVALPFDC